MLMMTSHAGPRGLVQQLRTTLESLSDDLVRGHVDGLLEIEPQLADLSARLSALDPGQSDLPTRDELLALRAVLRRCEELGSTIVGLNEIYATAGGGYDRSGQFPAPGAPGVLQARG